MPFWIQERRNPQLGTYYIARGKMFVKDAKKAERPVYGSNVMHRFDSEEAYRSRLQELRDSGEKVQAF